MKKQKTIPLKKQSKKAQREYYTGRRGSWNGLSPVTRMPANPKAYQRAKDGIELQKRLNQSDKSQ